MRARHTTSDRPARNLVRTQHRSTAEARRLRPIADPEAGPRVQADRRLFEQLRDPRHPVDRDAVVERFLPLARQLAARYQRAEEPFDDVFQVACYALVKAVDRYDVDRDVAFSSYAVPTITGEIKRHFRDRAWSVRISRDLQDLAVRVQHTERSARARLGRAPTVVEVAEEAGLTAEQVVEAMEAAGAYHAQSLDARLDGPDEDGDASLGDLLGDPEDGYTGAEMRADLRSLMRGLTRRERAIVRLRFEHDLTQSEIGARIGVSQMQVSRELRRAIAKLRSHAGVGDDTDAPHVAGAAPLTDAAA